MKIFGFVIFSNFLLVLWLATDVNQLCWTESLLQCTLLKKLNSGCIIGWNLIDYAWVCCRLVNAKLSPALVGSGPGCCNFTIYYFRRDYCTTLNGWLVFIFILFHYVAA